MSSEITINHTSFGQSSNSADTLVIELSENLIQFCELESAQNKPLFICDYPIENVLKHTLSEHFISAIKHFQFLKKHFEFYYKLLHHHSHQHDQIYQYHFLHKIYLMHANMLLIQ